MGLVGDIVSIVDGVTSSLGFQSRVVVRSFKADAGVGDPTYNEKSYTAVVERKQRTVRTFSGEEAASSTSVLILKKGVLVKEHDRIRLDDGTEAPVISTGGFVDGATNRQGYTEAFLG